ncbi:TlpA disulfide reductase family protein [Terrimonas ferruginea]|uniref:TlpA disulfide reductase family protein n=1 Tax=Terrimonas ferruginea TaxID=249 RepID=UPI0026EBF71E|nr:TlpA disulfide reductase family protein [Terrimonas ferruginea]
MMKQLLIGLGIVITLLSCGAKDTGTAKTSVHGRISGSKAKMVYLEEVPLGSMNPQVVDSAKLDKDGSFTLHSQAAEATLLNLRLDQFSFPILSLVNDTSEVDVTVRMNDQQPDFASDYDVKGSPASQRMKDYIVKVTGYLQDIYRDAVTFDSLRKQPGTDSLQAVATGRKKQTGIKLREYAFATVQEANNPALSVFALTYYLSAAGNQAYELEPVSDEELDKTIADLVKRYPAHKALAALKKSMDDANAQKPASLVGRPAPEFTLPDVNGKPVSLNSFRGKYLLVDFWASWCGPCRRENPNVVKAFQQFKDKNFTILGVSLDETKEAWMKAIVQDQLKWTQVSDLKHWESSVVGLYGIQGIPYNVLLDPDGKVIAENLTGSSLERKLSEVLK